MSVSGIPDNQIWYTSNDGNVIDVRTQPEVGSITAEHGLGSRIISNTYYDKGIIKTNGVITQIGIMAFQYKTSLVSIMFPKPVSAIYHHAFGGCASLSQIDLSSVTTIGDYAFSNCASLSQIDLRSVTTIDDYAFSNCASLSQIDLRSVTTIGDYAFSNCASLEEVILGENVTILDQYVFYGCTSLTTLYSQAKTPPSVSSYTFKNSSIKKVYVPLESVTAYENVPYWNSFTIEGYNFD